MAELQDPRDFPKALALLQGIDITLYIITAVVIYLYAGDDVASPALGSASPIVSKIAYGVGLPTVCSPPPTLVWLQCANSSVDYYRRCRLWSCCSQNNLHPHFRGN